MTKSPQRSDSPHWLDPPAWWKRLRPLRWLALIAVFGVLAHAAGLFRQLPGSERPMPALFGGGTHPDEAHFRRVAVGVDLVDRFRSYADLETVIAMLRSEGYGDHRVSTRRAPDSPRYPAYRFDAVVVDPFRHLGEAGRLSLQFFNDRLFEAEFEPRDPRAYARELRSLRLDRQPNARAEKVRGHQRIASTVELAISQVGVHLGTRPYVIWQDLRLIEERRLWDQRFGAIPKRLVSSY